MTSAFLELQTRLGSRVARMAGRLRRIRVGRAHLAYLHDVAMAGIAFAVAVYLRLGPEALTAGRDAMLQGAASFAAVAALVFAILRLYRGVWRYVSIPEILTIANAVTFATALYVPVMMIVPGLLSVPVETLFINWFVTCALLGGPRILYRLSVGRGFETADGPGYGRIPLLLVGAGDASELFLRGLARDASSKYCVVGMVDEMGNYLKRSIHGVEVMGSLAELAEVVGALDRKGCRPQRLVITEEHLSPASVRALLNEAVALGLTLSRIPRPTELRCGLSDSIEVQPVAIEDLLGRPQTVLDRRAMEALCHRAKVLITGAGGTIGGELVNQISDFGPAEMVLVDNSELRLYEIDMDLGARHATLPRKAIMADMRDPDRVEGILRRERPDLVFHAAAMKHVPMVEMHPCEGMLTNVLGTRNVADACIKTGVGTMVLISTDKAVNPTNVMGATKRIAESYCQALDILCAARRDGSGTRFMTVRFGNVLGSTGSVVPLFQRQLAAGGPLTVTHPHVTRYFMTTREAVELVLQACAAGADVERQSGSIFVLDMGEPVRIQDLARQMIRLAGLRPGRDIDIVFTGMRPGEKLYEEVLHAAEELRPTPIQGILLASPRTADYRLLCRLIDALVEAASRNDAARALELMAELVPEYQPAESDDDGAGRPGEAPSRDAPPAPHRRRGAGGPLSLVR
jgi:FlaA1/EpsC-like NDP-sugar epimerase